MLFLPDAAPASDMPVVARASDGPCRMTISGVGQYFAIEVTGLAPGEDLVFESLSEGEAIKSGTKASQSGTYASIVIPLVKGKTSGTATVIVTGSRCRIQASYPWRE